MRKPQALAISLGLHCAAFLSLMYAPLFSLPALPPPSPSEYQQAFAGKEDKIVWYQFHELPDIAPPESPKARKPLRADIQAKQTIVSSPKNAPKLDRVVVTPVPAIEPPPLDLPNLIAVKLPPRQFTTPPDLVRPEAPKIELPDAPEMLAQQLNAAKMPDVRLPARPYMPPPAAERIVAKIPAPSDSPVYQASSPLSAKLSAGLPAIRLPSRLYVPPPLRAPEAPRKIGDAMEVPEVAMNTPAAATLPAVRLPARAYAPPPAPMNPGKKPAIAVPQISVPPQINGPAGDVTMAIAGLNPATIPVKLPAASSPAQFSAGQTVRPEGATADGAGKIITVPDLYAHKAGETKPDLLALTYAAPTSKEFLDDALRRHQLVPSSSLSSSALASGTAVRRDATRVSNAPDPRFNGRDVYSMAIQMANLTSDSGSWLMWYSDRTARQAEVQPVTAPVPYRKVDPKYPPAMRADHIEGRVQLYCVIGRDGNVTSIELLRGADERLNLSAEEALSKWEFYPATRNGQPVDVDVVVEIPFVIAPPPPK